MKCVVCGKPVPHQLAETGGMHPWCSEPCATRWRTRNAFLFEKPGARTGEQVLGTLIAKGYLDGDPKLLAQMGSLSTSIRPLAKEHELGSLFHSPGTHVQQQGMKTVETVKTSLQPTGRKIEVEKVLKGVKTKGQVIKVKVNEMKEVRTVTSRQVPNYVSTAITADQMLEIALMAYNTAVELREKNLPVILYRVSSKGTLSKGEKNTQTLSSSVHAVVGSTEVWPLQKTAAWIQGAMRARVPFVLLNDPRADNMLIGGIDKQSDAIYVRELHQITSTHYTIGVASEAQTPSGLRGKTKVFILNPPAKTIGVMPLVPRITPEQWSHTWNTKETNLTLGSPASLIRDHLVKLFTEAGDKHGIAPY